MKKHILICLKCPSDVKMLFSTPKTATQETIDEPIDISSRSRSQSPFSVASSSSVSGCLESPEAAQKNITVTKSSTITSYFDTLSSKSQEDIDCALARAIFASGTPLSITENKYWQEAFKLIRPSYKLPSRYLLSKPLLDAEYMRVMQKVEQQLNEALSLSLLSDGWTNIRGDSIINFIICTPQPVFYKSIDSSDKKHTAEFISNEMVKVIEKVGSGKFFALITDNASNMKSAWQIIIEQYPNVTPLGCFAHGMNLLLNDIMELSTMDGIFKKAKRVVKYIKAIHIVSAEFKKKQNEKFGPSKATSLKLPCKTRWGGVVIMFESLENGKESLQEIAIMEHLKIDKTIRCLILDNDIFWEKLQLSSKILKPIASAITKSEANEALLSDAFELWECVSKEINSTLTDSPLNLSEKLKIQDILEKRKSFCLQPAHAAANLLDPRYKGQCLSDEDVCNAFDFISSKANHLGLNVGKIMSNVAEYRSSTGFWSRKSIWDSSKYINPTTWWSGLCTTQYLNHLASRLLQVPPTSAACERNWSTFGNTHTKLRNRLSVATVEKLVAIRSNLNLHEEPKMSIEPFSSSEESGNTDSE